jgi:hypothetical protein
MAEHKFAHRRQQPSLRTPTTPGDSRMCGGEVGIWEALSPQAELLSKNGRIASLLKYVLLQRVEPPLDDSIELRPISSRSAFAWLLEMV